MFTPEERSALREALLDRARSDGEISAAAITGSVARDAEDRWSDIDLAFAVVPGVEVSTVLERWGEAMASEHGAITSLDVPHGATTYRVFLLANGLQVDLAFSPAPEFRALAPTFRLVFGESAPPRHAPPPTADRIIGLAWLHALHVRSALARGRTWQAEWMLSATRDHVLSLACLRHDLPAHQARGTDDLPAAVTAPLADALPRTLAPVDLAASFEAVIESLLREIEIHDLDLATSLTPTLRALASDTRAALEESRGGEARPSVDGSP